MKKHLAILLILICAFLLFTGSAFAKSAPNAMSFFTNSSYNKTYIDGDGIEHTMTVKWVGETWNKVGTVIYSINYEDVYQIDGNTYIDVKSTTKIYENARQSYPDSPEHSVYQVKWYPDGSQKVVSDYRSAEPEPTPTSKPTEKPEATPSATPAPTTKTTPSSTPAAKDQASTKPKENVTPKPMPEPITANSEIAPKDTIPSDAIPAISEMQETMTNENVAPATSAPVPEEEPVLSIQAVDTANSKRVWPVIVLIVIGAAILLARYLQRKRGKETRDNESD